MADKKESTTPLAVAREGLPFIIAGVLVGGVLLGAWFAVRKTAIAIASGVAFVFGLFSVFFFRDPHRVPPDQPGAVVSPGDGVLVDIAEESHPAVSDRATRVSVFLSIFDVHVSRIPVSGLVTLAEYRPGKFLAAFNDKASVENEQIFAAVRTDRGDIVGFKLIAGLIARRIKFVPEVGDRVSIGERCGIIRFGSRVDIILPPGTDLQVSKGDRVRGGESIIGILPW